MILCLSCYSLSPRGATFCQTCGKSFGARLCSSKSRHRNHVGAQFCATCGSQRLTEPTLYVPFGCLTWLVSWLLLYLLVKWLWPYISQVVGWLFQPMFPLFTCLIGYGIYWAMVAGVIYFFLSLIPGDVGKLLRQGFSASLKLLIRLTLSTLKVAATLVRASVSSRSLKP
ncbi:MAG: hypothetical protein M3347_18295 [Armatimonadota bacterium]|nr:hypothetical protein [Armatimonadota bacterium]